MKYLSLLFILVLIVIMTYNGRSRLYDRNDAIRFQSHTQRGGAQSTLISDITFSSNTDKLKTVMTGLAADAKLTGNKSWRGDPNKAMFSYLQLDLPTTYYLDAIVTKGRPIDNEWVTQFAIEYWNVYTESWEKIDRMFNGNTDSNGQISSDLNLLTNKIRVFPYAWNDNPSMRVGLIGYAKSFSKCKFFRTKMTTAATTEDKSRYKNLYEKNCLKVRKDTYDDIVNQLKKTTENFLQTQCQQRENQKSLMDLQKKYDDITNKFKTLRKTSCPKEQLIDLAKKYHTLQVLMSKANPSGIPERINT